MKRKIALILSFIFVLTLAIPAGGFAASMDKALENAIKIAKTKFTIPEDYKFTSDISTENNKNIFNLYWRSADTVESGSINVRVDENGTIIGYNKYSQSDYIQTKKLPKFSREDAKIKADAYIKEIDPTLPGKIKYEENAQGNVMDTQYYLSYYRVINGVPFYNDRVTVNINRETGALQDFSRQWTDNLTFPAVTGTLSMQKAQEAYTKNLGLKLIYKYTNTDDVLKAYAVYTPVYDNAGYGVNALTGELQRTSGGYYYGFGGSAVATASSKNMRDGAVGVQLNPDEAKAVENASKLMSKDEAEKIARNAKFLNITVDSKLQSNYLNTNWPSKEDYVWSLQFNKPAGDKNKYDEYTYVAINAKSGEITSFNRSMQAFDSTVKPKGDITAAKAAVDAFLQENYPQYYRQSEYDKLASESYLNGSSNTSFNFIYSRIVNGIAFPDNGLNVTYDNINGTITGFNLTWFNIAFPSVKALGIPAASEKLLNLVGLDLNYKFEYSNDPVNIKIAANLPVNSKVVLVYTLIQNKPLFLDADTGSLLNNDGSIYKETVKVNYSDIKGNTAEKQIMVLADNGVYLEGAQFNPNSAITQRDFLTLLSKTLNYYGPVIRATSTEKDVDELYAFMQREGIVKAGEKAPDSGVTREDAVKYLIRALKYDKVADIKGIFNIGFKDKASISPNLSGHVAIASGLGIVDAKSAEFKPKAKMTRGESAIMIYNYLQN